MEMGSEELIMKQIKLEPVEDSPEHQHLYEALQQLNHYVQPGLETHISGGSCALLKVEQGDSDPESGPVGVGLSHRPLMTGTGSQRSPQHAEPGSDNGDPLLAASFKIEIDIAEDPLLHVFKQEYCLENPDSSTNLLENEKSDGLCSPSSKTFGGLAEKENKSKQRQKKKRERDTRTNHLHHTHVHGLLSEPSRLDSCEIPAPSQKAQCPGQEIINRKKTARRKSYVCSECGKTYRRAANLKKHKLTHENTDSEDSDAIDTPSSEAGDLQVEESKQKDDKAFYVCNECGKALTGLASLQRHKIIHTGLRPHACHDCGKAFSDQSSLRQHISIHTGEKPFVCQVCEKSFNRKRDLKRHVFIHSDVKPLSCSVCKKGFIQSVRLKEHMMIHHKGGERTSRPRRPVVNVCEQCGKTFNQKSHLTRHMLIHSGIRAHKCPLCTKAFTLAGDMRYHLWAIHEKPYSREK